MGGGGGRYFGQNPKEQQLFFGTSFLILIAFVWWKWVFDNGKFPPGKGKNISLGKDKCKMKWYLLWGNTSLLSLIIKIFQTKNHFLSWTKWSPPARPPPPSRKVRKVVHKRQPSKATFPQEPPDFVYVFVKLMFLFPLYCK